jgi:hypothetical protein
LLNNRAQKRFNSVNSSILVAKTFFSSPTHLMIASLAGFAFCVLLPLSDQFLFFSPFLAFYVPNDMLPNFLLSCINSLLLGILVIFNLHILRNFRLRVSKSALSGTTLSIISSACVSCSTLGLTLASTFGGIGIVASNLLLSNQILIREISTAILLFALYTCYVKINDSCKLPFRIQAQDKSNKSSF